MALILLEIIFVFWFQDKAFLRFLHSLYLSGAFFLMKLKLGLLNNLLKIHGGAVFVTVLENTQRWFTSVETAWHQQIWFLPFLSPEQTVQYSARGCGLPFGPTCFFVQMNKTGIIKFNYLFFFGRWSNKANLWSFWRISPLIVDCHVTSCIGSWYRESCICEPLCLLGLVIHHDPCKKQKNNISGWRFRMVNGYWKSWILEWIVRHTQLGSKPMPVTVFNLPRSLPFCFW